jgi:hypothetical protein
MTMHAIHAGPEQRAMFLVDGCPRCAEYARDLGIHFTEERFRAFWRKMVEVEFNDYGAYASQLDKQLGRQLYLVALAITRVTGNPDPLAIIGEARP